MPETNHFPAPDEGQPDRRHLFFWSIGGISAILLAIHVALRVEYGTMKDGLDAIALGLVVIGLSPFIATVIKSLKFGGVEVSFQEVKERVDRQETEIAKQSRRIDEIYALSMGPKVFMHLEKLIRPGGYREVYVGVALPRELGYLENLGFIEFKGGLEGLDALLRKYDRRNLPNLSDFIAVTPAGMMFYELRMTSLPATKAATQSGQKEGARA